MRRLLSISRVGRWSVATAGSVGVAAGGLHMARNRMATAAAAVSPATPAVPSSAVPFATPIVPSYVITAQGIAPGFIGAIGNTPLIELKTLSDATGCRILAKAEHLNPGGSVKDRAARWMVEEAERSGLLKPGGTIVEGTGGNTGIGLALVANARGYKTILCMPETISPEKIELMKTFGATVMLQPAVPFADQRHYYHVADRIARETPGAVWVNQFENQANAQSHIEGTGPEIWQQTGGKVDGVCVSAGTGGTIGGFSTYFKSKNPNCQVYLIDPPGSGLFNFLTEGKFVAEGSSITEGIGIMRKTANFGMSVCDGQFRGVEQETVEMAYYLLRNEGIFVGPSAALNILGAVKLARKLGPGKTVVTVICDGGDRARSKLWNPSFLATKGLTPVAKGTGLEWISS